MPPLNPTALHEFLRSRRSVRRFSHQPVPADCVHRLIETASHAPSAHNRQPWRFVILSDKNRKALAEAMGTDFRRTLLDEGITPAEAADQVQRSRDRISTAPEAVLLCLDTSILDQYDDPIRDQGEHTMAVQSVAMAGSHFLLSAHAEGLGAVWLCAPLFAPRIVRQILHLPDAWLPQGMILLGYAENIPAPRPRKPLSDITLLR